MIRNPSNRKHRDSLVIFSNEERNSCFDDHEATAGVAPAHCADSRDS